MKRILTSTSIFLLFISSSVLADVNGPKERLSYAAKLFHGANYNKAVAELQFIYRDLPEASYLMGMSYRDLGELNSASEWFQKASEHKPLGDYALFHLGKIQLNAGDYQSALSTFQALSTRFPESRWRHDASFNTADILFQMGRHKEAKQSFERFMKENPGSLLIPKALTKISQGLENDGKSEEAYNSYKSLWLHYPSSPESRKAYDRMTELLSIKEPSANLTSPTVDDRFNRAGKLLSSGNYREGITELVSILKEVEKEGAETPKWIEEAKVKLGDAYYQIKEDEKAGAVLKNVFKADSKSELLKDALFLYGKVLQRSGKRGDAASNFEKIINEYSGEHLAVKAIFRLADMAEGDRDTIKAKELYHKIYAEFPKNSLADDALWKEGWLCYTEGDYNGASLLFQRLLAEHPTSEFADTASYWSGRSAEKTGKNEEAVSRYTGIINDFPLSYYASLSRGRLSYLAPERALSSKIKKASLTSLDKKRSSNSYVSFHLNKGKVLLGLGFIDDASVELSMAEERCSDKGTLLEIARLMTKAEDYNRAKRVAINSFPEYLKEDVGEPDAEIWRLAFPAGFSENVRYNAERNSLSPYLIHAIIREESSYRIDAVSRAGAIGLMQLMPFTGSSISKEKGFKDYTASSLYRPDVNINLGTLYLKKVIESYKGNLSLAIASYNAGPNAVNAWVSRYGVEEMDEFVERIPYAETRNYVKKVLRSYEVYERLYGSGKSDSSGKVAVNDIAVIR